jgi:hypothetical protein
MMLVKAVRRLESAAAARLALVLGADEVPVPLEPGEGEHVAHDLCFLASEDGRRRTGSQQRLSREPGDLGDVYDDVGELIGRVTDVAWSGRPGDVALVTWDTFCEETPRRSSAGGA